MLEWIAKKFQNGAFINYEQIHPNDGFGTIMLKHFDKLQSSLFSVKKYPDCDSHYLRYKNLVCFIIILSLFFFFKSLYYFLYIRFNYVLGISK
mgnify:CR=1 FL=1